MSFKIKNSQLSNDALMSINNLLEADIDAVTAFKLTRIIKFISPIVEDKLTTEKKIYDKYAQKDSDGNFSCAKDESGNDIPDTVVLSDVEEFTNEMSKLYAVENEIPYEKIKFEDLKLQTAKVKDLIKLDFLFE
jgi:hypothetical protein